MGQEFFSKIYFPCIYLPKQYTFLHTKNRLSLPQGAPDLLHLCLKFNKISGGASPPPLLLSARCARVYASLRSANCPVKNSLFWLQLLAGLYTGHFKTNRTHCLPSKIRTVHSICMELLGNHIPSMHGISYQFHHHIFKIVEMRAV